MQSRIEASPVGRALISLIVLAILGAVVSVNLPDSVIRSYLLNHGAAPMLRATGLDQGWGVFADVRRITLYVDAHLDYADGTSELVPIPNRPGLAAMSDYRWQKYEENVRLDENQRLWRPYADWLVARARADGRRPVRVSLARRFTYTKPPGPGPEHGDWNEFTFYTVDVGQP